jgi:hypothetical protein
VGFNLGLIIFGIKIKLFYLNKKNLKNLQKKLKIKN